MPIFLRPLIYKGYFRFPTFHSIEYQIVKPLLKVLVIFCASVPPNNKFQSHPAETYLINSLHRCQAGPSGAPVYLLVGLLLVESLWVRNSNKELEFDTVLLLPDSAGGLNSALVHAGLQQLASELRTS